VAAGMVSRIVRMSKISCQPSVVSARATLLLIVLATLLAAGVSGCGQKGPLVLPPAAAASAAAAPTR